MEEQVVQVPAGAVTLQGNLDVPAGAHGVVLFAHGSGSSRHSPRNRYVAGVLREAGLATVLMDLLTADEEAIDLQTQRLRFDISLLADRLVGATDWLAQNPHTRDLKIGYFGASTGAAAPWWPRRSGLTLSAQSSRAGGDPTWPGQRWRAFGRPRCSSSVETTSRSSA